MKDPFPVPVTPDWEGLVKTLQRKEASRAHFIELHLDEEVVEVIRKRFGVAESLEPGEPFFSEKRHVAIQSFLGYDYVPGGIEGIDLPLKSHTVDDTADLARQTGRTYVDEHKGPITTWEEFEAYPWPDPNGGDTSSLEWYQKNLPDNMCVVARGTFGSPAEYLSWLMGYETMCVALCIDRDLVKAICDRLSDIYRTVLTRTLQFDRVKITWASDDMGFKGGTLISPDDMREFVLPIHKELAEISHNAGRPYLLHSCGNLELIIDDLIDDVRIDAKHSFEDTIEQVTDVKDTYGQRIALLGGIDMDFLCRSTEDEVHARVRATLEKCMPGGGYCLGTGNTMANYVPLDNYLAMLDEGRRFTR